MTDNVAVRNDLRLVTVKALPMTPGYEWLSEASLRHLIFNAQGRINSKGETIRGNGLDRALIRVGRKVLIDLDEMALWLELQRTDSHLSDLNL